MESPATMTSAVACAPPAVARIVLCPAAVAVRNPDASTAATPGSSLDHAIVRPNTRSPAAFRNSADNSTAPPGGTVGARGVTATDPTAPPNTARHVPDAEPHVAVPLSCAGDPESTPM